MGSIAGAGTYYLGAKALTTGVNNLSTTVSGLITGGGLGGGTGGSLTKMGTGTLTLSGTDTYSGGTVVLQGTLAVASPGALGTGLVLVNGGTFETGGGPLTINVGGSYTQSSSGTLQMGLGGTAAGQWDILKVTGNASLAGTLQVVSDSGFTPVIGNTFLILGASGVSGTFSSLANPFTSIRLLPLYGSTGVQLEAIVPSFSQVALTPNQKVVANLLDQVFLDTSLQNLIASLGIQSAGSLPGDFDQISPVGLTPVYKIGFELARAQALFVGQRMDEIWGGNNLGGSSARAINGDGPMLAANMSAEQERAMTKTVSMKNPWDVFVNGNGNFGTVTADSNSPGYQFTTGGLTAGLDYRLGKDLVGGLLLGYSQTNATQANGGSVNVTGGQAGLYGGWQSQSFHLEALVDGGMNSYKTSRAGYGGTAQASPQGIQYGGQLGFGYDWQVEDLTLGPFASGQYTYVQLNGFSEQGSLAPLNLPAQGQGSLLSDLGARVSADWTSGNFVLSPNLSVAWEHQYQGNQDSLTAGLVTGGNQFSINGPATGTDAAVVGAGLSAQFNKGMNAYVQYQGKIGLTNYD
ncbi:MAG TPA: autotransporter domain-containing protein, partial [bacterium]